MSTTQVTEALGYLMFQICRAHRNRAQELLSELGLYTGQEVLLMHLCEEDGQTQSALAEKLCIAHATLTKTLNRMEESGLVVRQSDPQDGRVMRVSISEQGRKLQEAIEAV